MSNTPNKQKELERLQEEVALVQRKIDLLHLIDDKEKEIEAERNVRATQTTPPRRPRTHIDQFPEETKVVFSSPNEKWDLRGKKGVVDGHTPKFVKVKRHGQIHLRFAKNLSKDESSATSEQEDGRGERA